MNTMEGETLFCYKDMTFCGSDCVNTRCLRNFSPEQQANAIKWWGDATAPVAFSNGFKDGCKEYKAPTGTKEINNAVA